MIINFGLLLMGDTPDGVLAGGNTVRNNGLGEMVLRIGLFMIFLLIFVFVCAYAWRTIPALRALIPPPKPKEEQAPSEPRLIAYLKPIKSETAAERQSAISLITPLASRQSDPIAAAIADGRPGSVVQAASDLEGMPSPPAIIIVKRED